MNIHQNINIMKKKTYILLFGIVMMCYTGYAQVAINTDGSQPDNTAILDIKSTDKGVLIPRMTGTQRTSISSPATGLTVYDTDDNHYYFFNGTSWIRLYDGNLSINDLTDAASDGKSVFLGSNAGINDDGLNYNAGTGIKALYTNTSGSFNVAFGMKSLYFNTTGNYNTATGTWSLYNNTTGKNNVAVGANTGYYNQEGKNNVFIGYSAGKGTALQNISGEVFIGYQAGINETNSNRLYIENSNSSSPLIYGEFDNDLLRINGTLNIMGAYSFPTSDCSAGEVLTTNGSGILSWTHANGATEIDELTDGKTGGGSVFLGNDAGNNDDGNNNNNTALGYNALSNNSKGSNNIGIGYYALTGFYSGTGNIAIGNLSLSTHATFNHNVAVGNWSLNNTTGDDNVGVGEHALCNTTTGSENVGIGSFSLNNNTTGSDNVAVGQYANYTNTEGSNNTMIGSYAGGNTSEHTLSGEIFIGYEAGYNETNSNRLYIENSNSSSPLIYGEFDNDLLRINGTLNINNAYSFPTSDGTTGQMLKTDGSGNLTWTSDIGISELNELTDAKTGGNSVFLGADAGLNEDGSNRNNVAVGINALKSATNGSSNIAIGYNSLTSLESGQANIAIGNHALEKSNATVTQNLAIGINALYNTTTGYRNVCIGNWSNFYNQEGNSNTIIGYEAGKGTSLHNISGNIFIGFQAGYNENGNNKLYIENSNSSSPLIYGEFDNDLLRINGTLDINSAYHFPTADGNSNQVLSTDGSGNVTWANKGAEEINDLNDGKSNGNDIFLGQNAGSNFSSSNAKNNTAMGYSAMYNAGYGAEFNTAIGAQTLHTNIDGDNNIAIGYRALFSNNNDMNTAVGCYSLYNNTSDSNTAIGFQSAYNNTTGTSNVAIGVNALKFNQTGSFNCAMGNYALHNGTGSANVAVGYKALQNNINGSYNTAVGLNAGYSNTRNYSGTFGYNALAAGDGKIKIGDNTYVTWIGGHSPWHSTADSRFSNEVKENVPGLDFIMKLRPVTFKCNNNKLEQFIGLPASILNETDEKGKLLAEKNQEKVRTGFIAQDVEKIAKKMGYDFDGVYHPQNDHDVYSLAYSEFVVPLIKAVQEQEQLIEQQQKTITMMQTEVENLKTEMINLKKK